MIGYVAASARGETDLFLARIAEKLMAQGLRVAGTVQVNTDRTCGGLCDMDVRVLPQGPVLRISQDLGANARGCRLDTAALEQAVGLVEAVLADGADVLVVNKFGKHEAQGRGFRGVIAEAVAREIPVICGTNALNQPALTAFAGEMAQPLASSEDAVLRWLEPQLNALYV